jgi:6-methylsalicylate decarboxylase
MTKGRSTAGSKGCDCGTPWTRRSVLGGIATMPLLGFSDPGRATIAAPHRIDVHHHFLPPAYVARKREQVIRISSGIDSVLHWVPQRSIEAMDEHGIETSFLSLSAPGVWFGDAEEARSLARLCNDYAAEAKSDHRGRFRFFAVLPFPDVEGSLREIAYAFDTLGADGVGLFTNYAGKYLGDASLFPLYEELNRRKAAVYVHPILAPCCAGLQPAIPPAFLEFPFDTTRSVTSLLYSGALERFPDIRFIFSHGAGAVPMLVERIAAIATLPRSEVVPVQDPVGQLRRIYVDTASITNPAAFGAARALLPIEHILFGTDYPYTPPQLGLQGIPRLGLSQSETRLIERDNALRLLGQTERRR